MAHSGRYLTRWLFLGLLLTGTAAALRAQSRVPGAPPVLIVRLMSWQGELRNLSVGPETPGAALLVAPEFGLSAETKIERKGPVVSIFQIHGQGEDRQRRLVAEAPVPLNAQAAIILLAPAPPGGPADFAARVIDNSPGTHPAGSLRLLNFSSRALALRVGSQPLTAEPGGDRLFSYAAAGTPRIFFQLAAQTDAGWKMIQRFLQPAPPEGRLLCLVRDGRIPAGTFVPGEKGALVDSIFIVQ